MSAPGHRQTSPWTIGIKLVLLQVVVWALIDCSLLAARHHPDRLFILLMPMVAAQLATLAGWLALGDGHWFFRVLAVIAAICLVELVSQLSGEHVPPGDLAALAAAYIATLTAPLMLLRAFGCSCRQAHDASRIVIKPWQFKIWHILALTAVVAIMLGLFRVAPRSNLDAAASAAVAALVVGTLPWTQWFVMLRPNIETWLPLGLFVLLAGCLVSAVLTIPHSDTGIVLVVMHTAVLGINLYIFRANGYCLVRLSTSRSASGL